ncbi:RasGEF domain containing protein [Ceratobasidium theobromae]|uniref:RasGEF domain containing protein n=1 Tax=Ceratobasidium theobromae TaxID=1582974 RepID=A0A5N5QSD6_9AGAM|nr:RasGEF domain containing protein [Ceratobasidium theobromae]
MMSEGFFALCLHQYRGPDSGYLDVYPGSIVIVWRVEPSGWAGALDMDGGWGWIPFGYVRQLDDETVGVLEPIAQQLRLGAFRAMTAIRATATDPEGYSSPDSSESDALGDEWAIGPRQRRASRPTTRASLDEPIVQFAPSSFVPRVRAFRLRSKSRDRHSDSERPRRPSVSLRKPSPVPWYLQVRTRDIVLDADGTVRAASLGAVAERLASEPSGPLRRTVLFTYEAFTTSQRLFDLVTDQYSLEPPRELTESQFAEWKDLRLRPAQARVLDVLGSWLQLPRLHLDDPELVDRISDFLKLVTKPDNLALDARAHLRSIDRMMAPPTHHRPPTPQRHRRRALKQRPFPTLPAPPVRSNSVSGALLLSPSSPAMRAASPQAPGYSSPAQGYSSPVQGSASPRRGFASPRSGAASPSLNHGSASPSPSPAIPSTSMSDRESGLGIRRAKSQRRHASASHFLSKSDHTDSLPGLLPGNRPSGVALLDPTALAHHLTLLESSLYMRVKRIQCLEWHKVNKSPKPACEEETNDLRAFCATSDRLAGWVKWSVLGLDTPTRRAEAVSVWVRVAEKCRLLNNTSSLSAIVAGLTSADVSRIPHTWHLVPSARAQRLDDLARLTSPAGGFAALKLLYANGGCGVPFVGMYLTALVHTADQFKDYVPGPCVEPGDESNREERTLSEPGTPTQLHSRLTFASTPPARSSIVSSSPLVLNTSPTTTRIALSTHNSPRARQQSLPAGIMAEPRTPTLPPPSPTVSTIPGHPMLINFIKRHKQAEIIGAMLKFQTWPYTILSAPEPPMSTIQPTWDMYPYSPSAPLYVTLNASAGGVAWIEEQLARVAKLVLDTDWPYERSLELYEEETGGRGQLGRDLMSPAGF